jgi:RNA polymerase sigma-70 factor (ECF subfamily)
MTESLDRSDADTADDAAVIARVLRGEKQAFAVLVSRYQQLLYRHALAIVLDHDVAADMVQDTFVRAYSNLRECRNHSRFRPWLFRTLRNRCLDHLKEASRRNVRLDDVAEPPAAEAEAPAAIVERNELRAEIMRALAQLPPVLREAFVLHCVEGMPYEAMAELLDASVSALKMRVLRAREALRVALQEADVTGEPSVSSLWQTP